MSVLQLSYTSRVRLPLAREDYFELLTIAQRRNGLDGITGLLAYDGLRFLQAFEGPEDVVNACMQRIARDDRHMSIVQLRRVWIETREFGTFAMAGIVPGIANGDLLEDIKGLVDGVTSPHLKAMFIGFAMMARQKMPLPNR